MKIDSLRYFLVLECLYKGETTYTFRTLRQKV